ncbi:MAG TPA: TetR/AcrR family transcriptional regulator [Vicinamibacterales bacterium]|nr:TetR/AcrR family transcriptional regulator [Vicinamibacterales bacterium]
MPTRSPVADSTRARLLTAASAEFSARGFDGAKVDRIAATARVNKAMLYYHFRSKAGLYHEILRELFDSLAVAVETARAGGGEPEEQLRRYIRAIAARAAERPDFPGIWLRELADGGRHLDPGVMLMLKRVLAVLTGILGDGQRAGVFGEAHPLVIQISIVSPLLFLSATAAVRERVSAAVPQLTHVTREMAVAHVESATLAALRASARPTDARRSQRGRS